MRDDGKTKKNGEYKRVISFRMQIITCCLISLVLTVLTMLVLGFTAYGLYSVVNRSGKPAQNNAVNRTLMYDYVINAENSAEIVEVEVADPVTIGIIEQDAPDRITMQKNTAAVLISIAVLAALGFFIMYFLLLTGKYSNYLNEITHGIRGLAEGRLDVRIPSRYSNELTEIAANFNDMAGRLEHILAQERGNEKARNDLVTSIAHDLRTPLTSVIGYLELVSENELAPETRNHYVEVAYRKAKRLQRLTDDLFSYIKFGSEDVTLDLMQLDVIKVIEQLLEEFYPNIQESQLELIVEKKAVKAIVNADGMLLARAFSNLLGNAIKYGRNGKVLKVVTEFEGDDVKIRIINYGEVIPEKDIANIFERFYRVDASRTEEQGGTGLGLAIAKNIIERHQGTITASSSLAGTEFTVTLHTEAGYAKEHYEG